MCMCVSSNTYIQTGIVILKFMALLLIPIRVCSYSNQLYLNEIYNVFKNLIFTKNICIKYCIFHNFGILPKLNANNFNNSKTLKHQTSNIENN